MILLSQKRRQPRKKSGNSFRGRTKSGVWPTYPTTKSDLQEIIKTGQKIEFIYLKKKHPKDCAQDQALYIYRILTQNVRKRVASNIKP